MSLFLCNTIVILGTTPLLWTCNCSGPNSIYNLNQIFPLRELYPKTCRGILAANLSANKVWWTSGKSRHSYMVFKFPHEHDYLFIGSPPRLLPCLWNILDDYHWPNSWFMIQKIVLILTCRRKQYEFAIKSQTCAHLFYCSALYFIRKKLLSQY